MIIYKDLLTDDEIVSDTWNLKEVDGVVYEIDAKKVKKSGTESFDIGANPSAEGGDDEEGGDSQEEWVLDVVDAFRLQEMSGFDKKTYSSSLKTYMKALVAKMKENGTSADTIKEFQTKASKFAPKILNNFKDYELYVGESMDPDGMLVLLNYREDGVTPYFTIWKHGLKEEKV
ncbi:MAG: hypothetical protein M1834_006046 [Cirrosporium novae-zelandiae]|nr:MAG: hypothetical protein M1834_006046 [Cirrosporium novae-zelandiae]